MAEEAITTPAEEVNSTETTPEVVVQNEQPETIGEALNPTQKKDDSVPLSTFLEMKKENKELARQMKDLKKSIEQGASRKEVSTDLQALSEKHGVDADFLQEFAETVRAQSQAEVEEKLKPLKEGERAKKIDEAFSTHFQKAMAQVPEFEGIVNRDVIKTLSLNPANANKTFIQIIEESYGHLVQGKRTLDTATTRAGKNDSLDVDMDRAKKDSTYFNDVMANPTLKKKYNDTLTDRLSSYL